MKNTIRIITAMTLVFIICFSLSSCAGVVDSIKNIIGNFTGAGNNGDDPPGGSEGEGSGNTDEGKEDNTPKETYTVKVLGGDMEPMSSVIVHLKGTDGEIIKRPVGVVGERVPGRADFVDIKPDTYTVEKITSTDGKISYYYKDVTLDENTKNVEITAYKSAGSPTYAIWGEISADYDEEVFAYEISAGSSYVADVKNNILYFIFVPESEGVYLVNFTPESGEANVGNYGGPMYVLKTDITALEHSDYRVSGETIKIEIPPLESENSQYTRVVIGVKLDAPSNGVINVYRDSELPDDPAYAPWNNIQPTEVPDAPIVLDSNAVLENVDITDSTTKVVLGDDGYYHLGDKNGKIVYIYISKPAAPYMEIAFGDVETNISWFEYDEDGNFVRKERYNYVIEAYEAVADGRLGVVPLTSELARIMRNWGDHNGWYDLDNENTCIFVDNRDQVVEDIAWLFACCTIK